MNNFAVAAVALMAVACNHDAWHQQYDPTAQKAREFETNFKNIVMDGKDIDANQKWTNVVNTTVSLTATKTGTLKIYAENPVGNVVAPLYEASVTDGKAMQFVVARPQDVTTLYAAIVDEDGYFVENMSFKATDTEATVQFFKSQTAKSAKRMNRTLQPTFKFPADADDSKFLADVPAGVEKLTENVGRANNYIDETWTDNLNIWGAATEAGGWQDRSGGTLYIKGNCDFSNRMFYFDGNSELYLLEGATLTLGVENGSTNLQTNTNIYIAEGAKLIAKGELMLNNGLHIFNHGTIEAPKLSTNSNSWLVNAGKVIVEGKISVENTLSVIENNGIIEAANLNTAGSGKVENNDSLRITGTTLINSNDNTWVNNGHWHTGYFFYHAASDEVINNCRLTVDEDFNINLGDNPGNGNFKMDAGSGVVTKNFNGGGNFTATYYRTDWYQDVTESFNGGPFFIYMGAGSVFKVIETATMNATKADYGIYGPEEGDYAVFQAKDIVAGKDEQGYEVTYGGNLFVASDTHFANGWSGQYPYIDIKDGARIAKFGDNADIHIDETKCNPGYNGKKVDPDPKQYIYFAFEDLGVSDDFDFNDVVVRIGVPDENGEADVELCAVGGTLETYVFNGDQQIGEEVHAEFGWDYGTYYVNDKGNTNKDGLVTPIKKIGTVTVAAGSTVADLPINIHVTQNGEERVITGPTQPQEIPFRVVVTGDAQGKWFWAKERINISDSYPEFGAWGANMNTNIDWYKHPVLGKVVKW